MPYAKDEAGHIWEVDGQGNPIRIVQQGNRGVTIGTPNPYPAQKAQVDINKTNADIRNDAARIALAEREAAQRQAALTAEMKAKGFVPDGKGGWTPDLNSSNSANQANITSADRTKALAQWGAANDLDKLIADLKIKAGQGPLRTSGIMGFQDYLPTSENDRFDKAGSAGRGIVKNALGLTGGENNTAQEASQNYGAYIPEASNKDGTILDTIERLEGLRDSARQKAVMTLGGIPDANGKITPVAPEKLKSVWNSDTYTPEQLAAAPIGAMEEARKIQPEMQAEMLQWYQDHPRGRADPQDYAAFRIYLDRKYGWNPPSDPQTTYGSWISDVYNDPKKKIEYSIPSPTEKMSGFDSLRSGAVNNRLGAAATGYLNMVGMGGVEALAGDQYDALNRANQDNGILGIAPMTLGEIGGAVTGTSILGKAAGAGLKGLTGAAAKAGIKPFIGANGARDIGALARAALGKRGAQFAGNVGTDTLYGGIYGGVTQGDPMSGALQAGIGSVAGAGVAKGVGGVAGGVGSAAARTLREKGIPLTVGQLVGDGGIAGRAVKKIEDGMTSIPLVGDIVQSRRLEGVKAFNDRAFNDALAPIGKTTPLIGNEGVDRLKDIGGTAYDQATQGLAGQLDPQFNTDMANVRGMGASLPPDFAGRLTTALNNRVGPIENAGAITGETYQQAVRGLKGYRGSASQAAPGFEQDYKAALGGGLDALRGQVERLGGQDVISGLGKADDAWRNIKTIEDAVGRARNGTRSGEPGVFMPSQLTDAAHQTSRKYPGARPFADLTDAGQRVLPSQIGDSGTFTRALVGGGLLAGSGAAGAGAGAAASENPVQGAAAGAGFGSSSALAAAALLALGGSKRGQKLLVGALDSRPAALRKLGRAVRKQSGLFGSAAIPLTLEGP